MMLKTKKPLPDEALQDKSSQAIIIEFEDKRLKIVGQGTISIKHILQLEPVSLEGFKSTMTLIGLSGRFAPTNIATIVRTFERAVKLAKCKRLDLASYHIMTAKQKNTDKNRLVSLLKFWLDSGFPGIGDDLTKVLPFEGGTASTKSNRLYSVTGGPYSDQEYDDLLSTYWYDYEYGTASLQNTVLNLLHASHSRRPIQYAHLKICDFENVGETNCVKGPRVSYPGAKDKGVSGFRLSKQETHPLSEDLWKLCNLQIRDSIAKFEEWTGHELSADDKQQIPFFLTPYKTLLIKKMNEVDKYATLSEYYSSEIWHISSPAIIKKLCVRSGSPVHSHRTGNLLNEFAYRMRYTKIKQLARLGASRQTLSYWLGQESLSAIDSYYNDPAELARKIQDGIGYIYAPIAQAFMGCLVEKENEATRGDDPSSRIEIDGDIALGNCGHEGFCSAAVPIPCYRCSKFQPWIDGPHEEVLARLLKRQEEENNIFLKSKSRRLLTPLQLDKDIRAVETVIALCKQRRESK
ncbi:hypothetical protein [Pseudomonas promysalinigenes]|uniref:Site-specific integrase n=1 Tax=Pseudomonas promysalinigenes TaxID=485898 RepID=A0ABY6AFM4_9PSED|nr:hypothetical protein [Pseudomonas promysalinigenes]UXH38374.1 hypothetical protein N5C08_15465 [Pseudomonas promysalinigenes]